MPRTGSQEKTKNKHGKIEIRAERSWIDRVDEFASRLGLKRSAYIRMVVVREMDREDEERSHREISR